MGSTPVDQIDKPLALRLGERPCHLAERHNIDSGEPDVGNRLERGIDQVLLLTDGLQFLALDHVIGEQSSGRNLAAREDEHVQLLLQCGAAGAELHAAQAIDPREGHERAPLNDQATLDQFSSRPDEHFEMTCKRHNMSTQPRGHQWPA